MSRGELAGWMVLRALLALVVMLRLERSNSPHRVPRQAARWILSACLGAADSERILFAVSEDGGGCINAATGADGRR